MNGLTKNGDFEFEMTDTERLAIAQAFYSAVGEMVSTKNPGNLRDRVNDEYKRLYELTGAKSFDVKLQGEKVGTFSLTVSKPTESVASTALEVVDKAALAEWAAVNGYTLVDMEAVERHFAESGEVPDGCAADEVVHPGDPGGRVTRTTMKVDAKAVMSALGPQLETVSYALLEGGE